MGVKNVTPEITQEAVDEFNKMLKYKGCAFCIVQKYEDDSHTFTIGLPSMELVDSLIINPTKEFYNLLEEFFAELDITLSYNNTRNIFWSRPRFEVSD